MKLALLLSAAVLLSASARAGDESLLPLRSWSITDFGALALGAADFDGNGRKEVVSLYSPGEGGDTFMDVFSIGPHGDVLAQWTNLPIAPGGYNAAADFDGDGREDLAIAGSSISIYRGSPDGTPTLWKTIVIGTSAGTGLAVADFDDDTWPDILVSEANTGSTKPFRLLHNTGGTGFQVLTAVSGSGMSPRPMALADLNADGNLDVLASEFSFDHVRVLLAQPSGLSFTSLGTHPVSDQPGEVRALDLTADGLPDMAVAVGGTASGITCRAGTGGGSFGAATNTPAAGSIPGLDAGDIDGDGDMDLVEGSIANGTYAYANTGSLPLAAPTSIHTMPITASVLMADVNGDGWRDFVAGPYSIAKRITLVYAGPHGMQAPSAASPLVADAISLHAADFTGDGQPDVLAVGGLSSKEIALSAGNGDGTFDPAVSTMPNGNYIGLQSTVARCNGDALNDVVMLVSAPGGPRVKLLLNLGASQKFQPGDEEPLGAVPVAGVLAADLDGDGGVEICVPTAAGVMRVWHVDASSSLVAVGSFPLPEVSGQFQLLNRMTAADVDEDGLLDVVFTRNLPKQVFVFPGQPGGTLGPATILDFSPDLDMSQVLAADVDEDGFVDLLGTGFGTTTLWPGQPGMQFGAPQTAPGGWQDPHLADVDADGHLDLVSFVTYTIGSDDPPYIAVQRGLGNGQFTSESRFTSSVTRLDVADFSSDGVPDVVTLADYPEVGAPNSDDVSVFVSRPFTTFDDLGYALGGIGGEPQFLAWGWLKPGQVGQLSVARAAPAVPAAMFVGLQQLPAPFKGGTLVPSVDIFLPGFVTDGDGRIQLGMTWPSGVPAGLDVVMQWWFADASGPSGFTASNALTAVTP